jgi:integrase
MPLTDTAIRNTRPEKPKKLFDGGGLFLLAKPNGSRLWRLKYRFGGKEKQLSLGSYPEVSLKKARDRRDKAREELADGLDPSQIRKTKKIISEQQAANSFEVVAREWLKKFSNRWSESYTLHTQQRLEKNVFPWLGTRPVHEISSPELLRLLRRLENRGIIDTAHRVKQNCGQIFRYAVATGRADRDPAADLKGALTPNKITHHATIIEPKAVGALMRAIDSYEGQFATQCALKLAPLLFVRPGELRHAEWSEIDFNSSEWRIPADKMKMKSQHIVPLAVQSISILRELQPLTGKRQYVFPGVHSPRRPISENTVNGALRRLGYTREELTGHGFRSMASTLLNEQSWNRDAIERQLAHAERDSVRAAYNYADYLPERRKMMQAWADYLDGLKNGVNDIPKKLT